MQHPDPCENFGQPIALRLDEKSSNSGDMTQEKITVLLRHLHGMSNHQCMVLILNRTTSRLIIKITGTNIPREQTKVDDPMGAHCARSILSFFLPSVRGIGGRLFVLAHMQTKVRGRRPAVATVLQLDAEPLLLPMDTKLGNGMPCWGSHGYKVQCI